MYLILNPGNKRARRKSYRKVLYQVKLKGITCQYAGESFLAYDVDHKQLIGIEKINTPNIKWIKNIPEFFELIKNPPHIKLSGTTLTSFEIAKFKEEHNSEQF